MPLSNNPWLLYRANEGDGGDGGGSGDGSAQGDGQSQEDNGGSSGRNADMVPRAEAQEARREAKNLRDRAKAAEEELAELKRSQLSDSEKVISERDTYKTRTSELETQNRNLRVQVVASRIGIVDPEAASALMNWDTVTDPSDLDQVEKALKALVKSKPYLAGNLGGGSDGGAGDGGTGSGNDMNTLIRRSAGRA